MTAQPTQRRGAGTLVYFTPNGYFKKLAHILTKHTIQLTYVKVVLFVYVQLADLTGVFPIIKSIFIF